MAFHRLLKMHYDPKHMGSWGASWWPGCGHISTFSDAVWVFRVAYFPALRQRLTETMTPDQLAFFPRKCVESCGA